MGEKKDPAPAGKRPTKKDQVLALAANGITEVADLALLTGSRPAYVANVLQEAGQAKGYFDLYTSAGAPMNVYSKYFAGKLAFRDEEAARASVEHIDRMYRQFGLSGDRAGQHHALVMALTMLDRARWTNKQREAEPFRRWLLERIAEDEPAPDAAPPRSKKKP
jgi:hypothetical protein